MSLYKLRLILYEPKNFLACNRLWKNMSEIMQQMMTQKIAWSVFLGNDKKNFNFKNPYYLLKSTQNI